MLEILACPDCRAKVHLVAGTADGSGEIAEGALECDGCSRRYVIRNGIPRMLPSDADGARPDEAARTAAHFANEFTAPELVKEDADISSERDVEYYFYSRTGVDPDVYERMPGSLYRFDIAESDAYRPDDSFLRGKRVLDAGCGPGRFTVVAAQTAGHVVGLDFGDHVDRAAQRCREFPNTDFVQGSALQPPFAPGTFDYVFTIGVLHHTPDPRLGCVSLGELVAPGGAMSVWVYPPEYWGDPLRRYVNRRLHARLSRLPPQDALDICARWLYPLGRIQTVLASRRWTKVLGAPLFVLTVPRHPRREVMISTIYDRFCPPIISTHNYEEVAEWLRDAGFNRLRRLPVPTAWFAEKRDERSDDLVPASP